MRIKKKFTTGTATNFVSRAQAIRKLQLSLKDFKRLCILKGIFPREPLNKKKANKGSTQNKIYYYAKDINFLASEPIINKFREYKVFLRQMKRAKAKKDTLRVKNMYESKEDINLDHLVKERFPTFTSALRDMDDALCVLFAFAVLPHTKIIKPALVAECRRLTAEFMHYVIESHSLMKCFISIKGIYYQAEIMGEKMTWLVGHERAVGRLGGVDLSVMASFAEFYITMLRFVNFRLYKQLGLYYPPQISTGVEESQDIKAFLRDSEAANVKTAKPSKTKSTASPGLSPARLTAKTNPRSTRSPKVKPKTLSRRSSVRPKLFARFSPSVNSS
ncbi:hypothetical protein L596_017314 [Steinernema carpocapsae]|uniref:Pescadillo homolog n=1 Tax=Steinernema carpocapsae TaxID=34508 RepID=A0A4U5N215_STECR|nr:hypothetical protein L596_017314 [Steinernema carpocapsae]